MRRMRRVMVGACVALTACGGGAEGFETMPTTAWLETTTPSPPVESPTAPSSTTIASTSPPTTSATTVATTVTTTVVETTTTLSIEQDVLAGLDEIEANTRVCLDAPVTCDPTTVATQDSPAHASFAKMIAWYATDGLVGRDVGLQRLIVEAVKPSPAGQVAVVEVCAVDGNWLVDPGVSSDPADDIVVNDAIESRRLEWSLIKTSDGWRRHSRTTLEEWLGEDRCPAS